MSNFLGVVVTVVITKHEKRTSKIESSKNTVLVNIE